MKKGYFVWLLAILAAFMLSACNDKAGNEDKNQSVQIPSEENTQIIKNADGNMEDTLEEIPEDISGENTESFAKESADNNMETGGIQMQELIISVGGQQFKAILYDNETAQEFMKRLPMTLNMEELHGNEKYYYLEEGLPTNVENIGRIQTGDIMLFGSDCLVLFYDDFSTSYSYTRIGHIEDEGVLADVLGNGSVEMVFEAEE